MLEDFRSCYGTAVYLMNVTVIKLDIYRIHTARLKEARLKQLFGFPKIEEKRPAQGTRDGAGDWAAPAVFICLT